MENAGDLVVHFITFYIDMRWLVLADSGLN